MSRFSLVTAETLPELVLKLNVLHEDANENDEFITVIEIVRHADSMLRAYTAVIDRVTIFSSELIAFEENTLSA